MNGRGTGYNKMLWICVAISAVCIIVAGFGFLSDSALSNKLMIGSLIVLIIIWAAMGISVWVYGAYDLHRTKKEEKD